MSFGALLWVFFSFFALFPLGQLLPLLTAPCGPRVRGRFSARLRQTLASRRQPPLPFSPPPGIRARASLPKRAAPSDLGSPPPFYPRRFPPVFFPSPYLLRSRNGQLDDVDSEGDEDYVLSPGGSSVEGGGGGGGGARDADSEDDVTSTDLEDSSEPDENSLGPMDPGEHRSPGDPEEGRSPRTRGQPSQTPDLVSTVRRFRRQSEAKVCRSQKFNARARAVPTATPRKPHSASGQTRDPPLQIRLEKG
ncbi:MAG: hypothetical protein BJ554DRAFT_8022 [Olpidium bornovanus]|uniref:Uncharacterized protein n=1 Tax=Olpidium bornovanus TaxID=278681 RepID=A0A8H7ZVY1_9FUNG|nr:MAG: hypothetical protein BJ554DRAFT_8022 [Olpidium bornovanus]